MNTQSWLDQIEKKLEQRLSEFLQANPYQDSLLNQQNAEDQNLHLEEERKSLKAQINLLREQILILSKSIFDWTNRANRAKKAGKISLAKKADKHLNHLFVQGRQLWEELDQVGKRFKEIEQELCNTFNQSDTEKFNLEEEWAMFEIKQEIEQLKSPGR